MIAMNIKRLMKLKFINDELGDLDKLDKSIIYKICSLNEHTAQSVYYNLPIFIFGDDSGCNLITYYSGSVNFYVNSILIEELKLKYKKHDTKYIKNRIRYLIDVVYNGDFF